MRRIDVDDQAQQPGEGAGALNLLGSHRHALDDKRRVAIPKAFREQVEASGERETYVLCRQLGGDECLALYPGDRFEAALARLETMRDGGLGIGSKKIRAYLRMVRMSAAVLTPDRQGRITLNEEQCRLAGIGKEAVFVGAGDHAEVWAPERLLPSADDEEQDFRELAHQLFG